MADVQKMSASGCCSPSVGSYSVSQGYKEREGEECTSRPTVGQNGALYRTVCAKNGYISDNPICCRDSSGYCCPHCKPDLALRLFSWINGWIKMSSSKDPLVKFRSPFFLATTLCSLFGMTSPRSRAASAWLVCFVCIQSVMIFNFFLPYLLAAFKSARRELDGLVSDGEASRTMKADLSFEAEVVHSQYQQKLVWLSVFKDRGGAALYFLCSAGRIWNSVLDGSFNMSHLGIYLPLALLFIVRLGFERRSARFTSWLSVAHIILSCSTVPCSFFVKPLRLETAHGVAVGVFEGVLTFLVNPIMFMATTCLSLPSVGTLYWEMIALGMSLMVLFPASAALVISQFLATGKVLGFDVGPDVGLPLLGFAVLPLLLSALVNLYHLVVLERTCLRYFLVGSSGFSYKLKSV